MGNIKKNGTITVMDDNGDLVEIYPVTKASNINNLDVAIQDKIDTLLNAMTTAGAITEAQRTTIVSILTSS